MNWRIEDIALETIKTDTTSRPNIISSLSRTTGIVLLLLFTFLGPGATSHAAEKEELIYSMAHGDNLWNITERYLDGGFRYWNSLIHLNKITDPKHMPPGTRIRIPLHWLKIDPATVRVRDMHGKVQYIAAKQTELRPLTSNTPLKDGDQVVVGEDANVVLEFIDKSRIFLGSGSQMTLDLVRKFSDTGLADNKLNLQKGRSESKVKTKNTRFQIKTPSANTTVRGTDFRVIVDSENPDLSRVEVLGGTVHTSSTGGTRNVTAGFGTTVAKGVAPRSLVKLLAAPEIYSPPNYSRDLPVDIKWQKIKGSRQYRVQILKAKGEQTLLIDELTSIARFNTGKLVDDNYLIRIRAIDTDGLEGKNAELEFQLDARPRPPLLISPESDKTVRTDLPEFEWSTPVGSTRYHFQLSEFSDLSSPLIDRKNFTDTRFIPKQLEPGTYYWRMSTLTEVKEGPFTPVQSFILRPTPEAPDLSKMSSEGDETNITLRWQSGKAGQQYKIQMAKDQEFKNIIKEELLQQSELATERPGERFFFRVKIIDVDGFEGDWSPAQQIEPLPDPWYYILVPVVPFLTVFFLAL